MRALDLFVFGVNTPKGLVTKTLPCPMCTGSSNLLGVFISTLSTLEFKCSSCQSTFRKTVET